MPRRTTTAAAVLVVAAGLTGAAVASAPGAPAPVDAVAATRTPAGTGPVPSGSDATATEQPADQPVASRPARTTGRNHDAPVPRLDGALTADAVPVLGTLAPLQDLDGWLQADGVAGLDDLRGAVTVVQLWTFSCSNCTATLPNLRGLRDAHAARDDFAIVGVHAPEFDFEADPDAVAAAVRDLDVTWPVALDNDRTNFRAWQDPGGRFWPRTFVLDRQGRVRFDHVGEGRYEELNQTVAALLADA